MPVFCNLRKGLGFRGIWRFGENFSRFFENPSHFSAIFALKKVKISLSNFRISLLDSRITLSNPKISLLDFRGVKIFAKILQFCALFWRKSRVKTFYLFVNILNLFSRFFPLFVLRLVPTPRFCLMQAFPCLWGMVRSFLCIFARKRFFKYIWRQQDNRR